MRMLTLPRIASGLVRASLASSLRPTNTRLNPTFHPNECRNVILRTFTSTTLLHASGNKAFYAVRNGRQKGVYSSWAEASEHVTGKLLKVKVSHNECLIPLSYVKGFSNAQFQGFGNK